MSHHTVSDEKLRKLVSELSLRQIHIVLSEISLRVQWAIDEQRRGKADAVIHACKELEDVALLFKDVFDPPRALLERKDL